MSKENCLFFLPLIPDRKKSGGRPIKWKSETARLTQERRLAYMLARRELSLHIPENSFIR